ncbi:c-type cytochrome [Paraburkholderia solisilvae]|uniref:Fructose dehydrogenase cytochrome subunit n=1 Tax=Paraburkholderia solisilvae TaxID=624376 RepID=A0A6J5DV30_9BURK|nr:cytochrome c [Paraburkholderia solisilvae]CAB3757334.1 Fructose dehydrogenase cytochrome subunit [Paraburkholderia solisilvae]
MTDSTSHGRPAGAGNLLREQRIARQRQFRRHAQRRRVVSIATLAAAFSLFALYIAWLEAHGTSSAHGDESPLAAAVARGPEAANGADSVELVKRGEYLARAGGCITCHTSDKSRPFAGGVAIGTPIGTIYTPNITPDPDTGIGQWGDADFLRAMHEGIGKAGERLYPVFPYPSYTKVLDRDVLAIRAYLNTVTPVHYTPPANELTFPFNQRWLMVIWNLFNFDEGRYVPDPKQSAEWNRGAYLVEGLAHCGECHTPRNVMQGLNAHDRFSGARQAGWHAFNITPDKISGIGDWSAADLVAYLATGVAPRRASAAGPMAQVVEDSTQYLSGEDLRSIAGYLRALPPVRGGVGGDMSAARDSHGAPAADVTALRGMATTGVNGAQLFIANCASCHGWTGEGIGAGAPGGYPSLIHNSVAGAADPANLAMVILHGVSRKTQQAEVLMPSFSSQLTDDQIAALARYVMTQFGNPHSSLTAAQVAQLRALQP